MPDDAELLLALALERVEEARELLLLKRWDASISRAYYGMFSAARALLSCRNSHPRTHRGVILELERMYVAEGVLEDVQVDALREARDLREQADYGIFARATRQEAEDVVEQAAAFVARAGQLLKDTPG